MKKYKSFILLLNNGKNIEVNAPTSKVTEKYALSVAYHWAKVNKDMVISVVGIK